MGRLANLALDGLTGGVIDAAVALGLVLVWRASRVLNFAQGAMAMFTTYLAASLLDRGVGYWAAFFVALAAGLILGAVVERVLVRPARRHDAPLNPVIVTIGLLFLLEALAGGIWGGQDRAFPAAFSQEGIMLGGTRIALSHFDVFTICAVLGVMGLLVILFRATDLGLKLRASAFSPEVARLLGVGVGKMLTLGWALAALVGSLAGLLVAPKVFLSPTNMDTVLVFGFTAAVLGGLDSPLGAIVGGLLTGEALSLVGGYLGSSLETLAAPALLLVALSVRPEGIFAGARQRRV